MFQYCPFSLPMRLRSSIFLHKNLLSGTLRHKVNRFCCSLDANHLEASQNSFAPEIGWGDSPEREIFFNLLKMNKTNNNFILIDDKLKQFANQLKAEIHSDSAMSDKAEERRIIWIDGIFGKAVIIQPDYDSGLVSQLWNLYNVAWRADERYAGKQAPHWIKYLMKKVPFQDIEQNIDQLLKQSAQNLEAVKRQQLRL